MTREEDVIELLDILSAGEVPAWLFGGWAVEAQIPEARRCHSDIDLIVCAESLDRARGLVENAGYTERPDPHDPCEHLRFGRRRGTVIVQLSSVRHGRTCWWLSVTGGPGARDMWLPCAFTGFPTEENGRLLRRSLRCATPEVLLQSKLSWCGDRQAERSDVPHLKSVLSKEAICRAVANGSLKSRQDADRDCFAASGKGSRSVR